MTAARRPILVGLALLLVSAQPGSGQGAEGAWDVRFGQSVRRNADGSVEVQRWGNAELVLGVAGDSVRGTWTTHVLQDVTWQVRGTLNGADLRLEAAERHPREGSEPLERIAWEGTVSGDTMEGRMALSFRDAPRPAIWSPFSGRRAAR